MVLAPGTKLGPYEIQVPIGAGGMGEVYRARDVRLRREVAIKVLPSAFAADPDRIRRFEQEARAAAALNHPNILAVHDVGTHDDSLYLVSELLEGGTLRDQLRGGPTLPRRAVDYAIQIARGLAAAHDKGIIHRDLKPENLFVTNDGRVKILDFGLAKLTLQEAVGAYTGAGPAPTIPVDSSPGVVLGTVAYMAPEQIRGLGADQRSDIFSLGAVLYEMLSGVRPFQGQTHADTISAILKEEAPELVSAIRIIPPALERIVRHCLEKQPQARFHSAHDLVFDLESLSVTSGSTAPVSPHRFGSQAGVRLRTVAIAFLLLTVGILGGILATRHVLKASVAQYRQLTFRRGMVSSARFAPDGNSVLYSAAWEGKPTELFSMRPEFPESHSLGLGRAHVAAISKTGEMAVLFEHRFMAHRQVLGTLAVLPFTGGAPREILEDVTEADWSPDGQQLAVARSVAGRYDIEFPIGKVLYETSGWLSDLRISPRGDMVAFLDHPIFPDDRGSVVVVASDARKITRSREFDGVQGVVWSSNGNEVWFAGGDLFAMTLRGDVRTVLTTGSNFVVHDISHDGRVLLSEDDRRVAMNLTTSPSRTERDFSWFDFGLVSDISPDGKLLLFSEQGAGGGPGYSVYLRHNDGSDPVRLGKGESFALSPDQKFALATVYSSPDQLWILPIGAGNPKQLPNIGFGHYYAANWFPDGKKVLFAGEEPGHKPRYYVQDIETGSVRPLTPERSRVSRTKSPISPDGKHILVPDADQKLWIYPVDGGEPQPLRGADPGELPLQWTSDGRALYLFTPAQAPSRIYRLSLDGKKELWKELQPADTTGLLAVVAATTTPDGRSYAYSYYRWLSTLYIVEGLK